MFVSYHLRFMLVLIVAKILMNTTSKIKTACNGVTIAPPGRGDPRARQTTPTTTPEPDTIFDSIVDCVALVYLIFG